jgi:hypothetical protein
MVSPSPFSTVPATPARDLVKRAETSLPEYRPEPIVEPAGRVEEEQNPPEPEEDLLLLAAEDLWPEEPAPVVPEPDPFTPVLPDVQLELEELDLDSLHDLTGEPLPESHPAAGALTESVSGFALLSVFPEEDDPVVTMSGLEELETLPADFDFPSSSPASHEVAEPDDSFAHLPVADSLIDVAGVAAVAGIAAHESVHEHVLEVHDPAPMAHQEPDVPQEVPEPVLAPAASGQAPAVPGHLAPVPAQPAAVTSELARAVVQAMLEDPVLVDALVKAVVARMGDQVLREIAWEVMPDLAGRLQQ